MQTWPIPSGGGIVRHMVVAKDDTLWMTESDLGRLARVRTKGVRSTR